MKPKSSKLTEEPLCFSIHFITAYTNHSLTNLLDKLLSIDASFDFVFHYFFHWIGTTHSGPNGSLGRSSSFFCSCSSCSTSCEIGTRSRSTHRLPSIHIIIMKHVFCIRLIRVSHRHEDLTPPPFHSPHSGDLIRDDIWIILSLPSSILLLFLIKRQITESVQGLFMQWNPDQTDFSIFIRLYVESYIWLESPSKMRQLPLLPSKGQMLN